MLELTMQTEEKGYALLKAFAEDELIRSLLLVHGLHPIDVETRIVQALDEVRPYLKSHGGNVELVGVEDGVAHLRLQGSCHGCPSSAMTLKLTIEEAISKAAPDLDGLEVEGVSEPPRQPARMGAPVTFVPPKRQKEAASDASKEPSSGGWQNVNGLEALQVGTLKAITLADKALIFCQIDGTYYAYYNRCSACQMPLRDSRLDGTTLTCSSCGQQYDVHHAGKRIDASPLFLEPIPLLVEENTVRVMLPKGNQSLLTPLGSER